MNEVALVEWIKQHAATPRSRDLVLGIGDDCAILRPRPTEDLLLKTDPLTAEGKPELVIAFQDATAAFDSAGICIFTSFAWGLADVAPQVAAACGPEFTLENLAKIGERIWNMERDFNNRAGFTAKDDNLPKRLLSEPAQAGPAKGLVSKLPEMLPKYYAARGWDADGRLKPETRQRLGL